MAISQPFENPRSQSDIFFSQLPIYDTTIEDLDYLRTKDRPAPGIGKIVTYLARMSDGSQNVVRSIVPEEQIFSPHVTFTTPLATRVNGFNTYVGIEMAQNGMAVDIIGAPQEMSDEEHLSHEAHNFAQILTGLKNSNSDPYDPMLGGMSRGGMEAFGIVSYMKRLGMAAKFMDVQDPCLANGLGLVETTKDMTPGYIARELSEGAKGVLERGDEERFIDVGRHVLNLGQTFGFSRKYLKTHSRIGRELWKGQAGELASALPPDIVAIIHTYNSSRFNHAHIFQAKTSGLPYTRIVRQEGYHLTMTRKSVTRAYVQQFITAQEMLRDGKTQAEIANALDYPLVGSNKLSLI